MTDVIKILKKKNKYMNAREIANETRQTIQSVSRKVRKLTPLFLDKKVKREKRGKCSMNVTYYRYRKT